MAALWLLLHEYMVRQHKAISWQTFDILAAFLNTISAVDHKWLQPLFPRTYVGALNFE